MTALELFFVFLHHLFMQNIAVSLFFFYNFPPKQYQPVPVCRFPLDQFYYLYKLQYFLQMIEDEQILLQNLSSDIPSTPPSFNNSNQIKFQGDHLYQWQAMQTEIITEKLNKGKYYIDWNQTHNHHYFTKPSFEDIEDALHLDQHQENNTLTHFQQSQQQADYSQLSKKLEIALNIIKSSLRAKEARLKEKRSQSNQPRKQREMKSLAKTACTFKGTEVKQRKISMNYRVRTEFQEEGPVQRQNPFFPNKMEKYQTHHIIAEEKEMASAKDCSKQNTLRNKFLHSIALWQEKKQKRIQQRIEKEMKLTMEGVTFTPEINAKSREIMKKKGVTTPIYQREHRQKKRELTERFNMDQKPHRVKL